MDGEGPFLWFSEDGPPQSFHRVPKAGLCLNAFLFVRREPEHGDTPGLVGDILLGRYADDPRWETLTGMDATRWRLHGKGFTVPASHLRLGEDPRDAARRIGERILGLHDLRYEEPQIATAFAVHPRFPERGAHYDLWFFVDAWLPRDARVETPAWWRELGWHDPRRVPDSEYARCHEEVVRRWLDFRARD